MLITSLAQITGFRASFHCNAAADRRGAAADAAVLPPTPPHAALLLQTKTGLHQSSQTDCILFSMTPFEQSYIGFLAVQPLARQYSVVSQYIYQDSKLLPHVSALLLLNWFKLVHGPLAKQQQAAYTKYLPRLDQPG